MEEININIANDFSKHLGARYIKLGDFSGELFYNNILEPKFKQAKEENKKLNIEIDGASPYGSSFVDESFGKLAREYGKDEVKNRLIITTTLYPHVVDIINKNWEKYNQK